MGDTWQQRFTNFFESALAQSADTLDVDGLRFLLNKSRPPPAMFSWIRSSAFAVAKSKLTADNVDRVLTCLHKIVETLETTCLVPTPHAECYFFPGPAGRDRIIELLDNAKHQVLICVFTITDDRLATAILNAHRRGVEVRLISDNDKALDPGADIAALRDAGIPVATDATPAHMHNKFAVFDNDFLLTGSYNWTWSASSQNNENIVIVDNPNLIARFKAEFNALWRQFRSQDPPSRDEAATKIQAAYRGHNTRRQSQQPRQ